MMYIEELWQLILCKTVREKQERKEFLFSVFVAVFDFEKKFTDFLQATVTANQHIIHISYKHIVHNMEWDCQTKVTKFGE